jgi:hypothetical protein
LIVLSSLLIAMVAMFCCVDGPPAHPDSHPVTSGEVADAGTAHHVVDVGPAQDRSADDDCVPTPTAVTAATVGLDVVVAEPPAGLHRATPAAPGSSNSVATAARLAPVAHRLCVMRT